MSAPRTLRRQPEDITSVMTTIDFHHAALRLAHRRAEQAGQRVVAERTLAQSVERALAILDYLGEASAPAKLRDITAACGLSVSTTHHLLRTLVERGYASRATTGLGYRLGQRAWALSRSPTGAAGWLDLALPLAQQVRDQTGEATVLAAFSQGRLQQLARLDSTQSRRAIHCSDELHNAAHAVALGKAILAWLPEPQIARLIADQGLLPLTPHTIVSLSELANSLRQARRHGFALDDEEFCPGVVSLACALRGPAGEVLGAIGCYMARPRATAARLVQVHATLSQAALDLARNFNV